MDSPPRRSRIPRPLLLLVLLLGITTLTAAGWTYAYARNRINVVQHIRTNGGEVQFDELPKCCPKWLPVPEWLLSADSARIVHAPFDLASIEALSELKSIKVLNGIDDAGLQSAPKFRQLSCLYLEDWWGEGSVRVSDTGMATLSKCSRLHVLVVQSKLITDAGLKSLTRLKLGKLDISRSQVTDVGLKELASMPLKELDLSDTKVTDRGLKHLAGLPLTDLVLRGTRVTDTGMQELVSLPLYGLYLCGTAVTAKGVLQFKMGPLGMLELDSQVDQEQRAEIEEALGIAVFYVPY